MNQISNVSIILVVKDINETADFYKTVFDFTEVSSIEDVRCLENTNCRLVLKHSEETKCISFGFTISNTNSLIDKIDKYGNINFVDPIDSAHSNFTINDNSGNIITINNSNYKRY